MKKIRPLNAREKRTWPKEVLVKLEKAGGPDPAAEERRQAYRQQVEQVLSQTSVSAYLEEVKSRLSIERKLQQ